MSAIKTILASLTKDHSDIEQWHHATVIINTLYKQYGKTIKSTEFIDDITTADPISGGLLKLLQEQWLINAKALKTLAKETHKVRAQQQNATQVHTSETHDDTQKTIENHFENTQTHERASDTIGLRVQKDQAIYKRTLDTDIQKLLNN